MKYFRSTPAVYAAICAQLDIAYGYPDAAAKTMRTLPLSSDLPADAAGMVYLAIQREYCDFILPSQLLADLLASGAVEEVEESTYRAVLPSPYG